MVGKIKKMIRSYEAQDMSQLDKNLIRGLHRRRLKDFDEDYKDQISNKSLF